MEWTHWLFACMILHVITLFAAGVVGILVDFRERCCWHRKGCSKSQRCMFDHE